MFFELYLSLCKMAVAADAVPKMQKLGEKMLSELPPEGVLEWGLCCVLMHECVCTCMHVCILASPCLDAGRGAKSCLELNFNSKSKMELTYKSLCWIATVL